MIYNAHFHFFNLLHLVSGTNLMKSMQQNLLTQQQKRRSEVYNVSKGVSSYRGSMASIDENDEGKERDRPTTPALNSRKSGLTLSGLVPLYA